MRVDESTGMAERDTRLLLFKEAIIKKLRSWWNLGMEKAM